MGEFWNIEREVGNVAVVVLDRKDKDVKSSPKKSSGS